MAGHDGPEFRGRQLDARAPQPHRGLADAIDFPLPIRRVQAPIRQRLFDAPVSSHSLFLRNRSIYVTGMPQYRTSKVCIAAGAIALLGWAASRPDEIVFDRQMI